MKDQSTSATTREDTERRIAQYEAHWARVRQMAAAREAVIEAAKDYFLNPGELISDKLIVLHDAVIALEKLEAEE